MFFHGIVQGVVIFFVYKLVQNRSTVMTFLGGAFTAIVHGMDSIHFWPDR